MRTCMVTTMDNPYNPFTHFDEWYAFDGMHRYHTCELLAAFARTSSLLEEDEYNDEVNRAVDELLDLNPYGIHMKVYEDNAELFIREANKVFNSPETQKQLNNIVKKYA